MADILIKGIQFPKFSPHVIEVYPDGTAIAQGKGIYGKAVPVPPHGRLIDADELIDDVRRHSESYFADDFAHEWVDKAPTVIPADKDINVPIKEDGET